jgi:plastocyanin
MIVLMELDEQKWTGLLWLLIILVLIGFAAATMYFGRDNKDLAAAVQPSVNRLTPTRQPRLYTVYYGLGVFSPTNIRIHVGDSVKFQNDSDTPIRIVSDRSGGVPELSGFDSVNDIPSKDSFTFAFTEAGTFRYHNGKNPNDEGTVIVRPQ